MYLSARHSIDLSVISKEVKKNTAQLVKEIFVIL